MQVEVTGDSVTDEVARLALRLRTAELLYGGDMVTSIVISKSIHFTSLWALDELFGDNNTSGRSGDVMYSRTKIQGKRKSNSVQCEDRNDPFLPEGMGSAFEDMLKAGIMKLSVTYCHSLHSIPSTLISELSSLIHLDLSNNRIREIQGELGIVLPFLKRLNLSHNLLKSLDKLQGLPSLTALDASSNYIPNLHRGPHMLLPLAGHLISLNLLDNPICSLPSYAGETVSLLPNLICFDMRYTKIYGTNGKSGKNVLPSSSRVVAVPKPNKTNGTSGSGHDFVVIKKPSAPSSRGYSEKHSPSKRPKKRESPFSSRKSGQGVGGSPDLIPFYPRYDEFRPSPGLLVESNKGSGQMHSNKYRDDASYASSIDSSDGK